MIVSVLCKCFQSKKFARDFTYISLNLDQGLPKKETMHGCPRVQESPWYYCFHWAVSVPDLRGCFYDQARVLLTQGRSPNTHFDLKCSPSVESQVELP